MIDTITAVVLGTMGAILGFMIPVIAQKIILYKCTKKNIVPEPDTRYTSYFFRCGTCMLCAVIWTFAGMKMESFPVALFLSILVTTAILIAIVDFRIRIIPNELVLFLSLTGIIFLLTHSGINSLIPAALSMIAMMILFTAVGGIVGFGKVGAGDVKLAGAMGLALGYPDIKAALIIMSSAILIYIITGLIARKLTLRSTFPFAPFMMLGTALTLIYKMF